MLRTTVFQANPKKWLSGLGALCLVGCAGGMAGGQASSVEGEPASTEASSGQGEASVEAPAGTPPAEGEAAGSKAPGASAGSGAAAAEGSATSSAPVATSKAAPVASALDPATEISRVCESICDKVKGACSGRAADFCRASCRDYVSTVDKCPTEVFEALSCQDHADPDLLCANIAAEQCSPPYRAMTECRAGKREPHPWGQARKIEETAVPGGLKPVRISAFQLTQQLPHEIAVKSESPYLAEVTIGQGRFEAKAEELVGKKLGDTTYLRTATRHVGPACEAKLRLHGRFETEHVIHMRFDTVCKDGTEIHGMAHFIPTGALFVSHTAPPGAALDEATRDAFLFGFKVLPVGSQEAAP